MNATLEPIIEEAMTINPDATHNNVEISRFHLQVATKKVKTRMKPCPPISIQNLFVLGMKKG